MRLCIHASILLTVFFLQEASLTHAGTLLLKNGIFHTRSHQPVVKGDLLIQNLKIAMIADRITSPADAVMDLEEAHVYPGMIAMTTTLGLLEINSVRATLDTTEVGQWTPEVLSWRAVNPSSELLPVARANGITHAQPIPLGGTLSGQSGLLQLDGWTLEDMLVKPSVGYHLFWPSAAIQHTPKALMAQPSNWKNPKDQKTAHRKKVEAITEFLASSKAYVQGLRSNETLSPIPSWEAMTAWVEGQEPLFIHASEHRQIQSVLDWVETNASKVVLVGGRDAWKSSCEILEHNSSRDRIVVRRSRILRDSERSIRRAGNKRVLADLGVNVKLRFSTDASVAKAIAPRRGLGRTRHIEVNQLWFAGED